MNSDIHIRLGQLLVGKRMTVSTAESCTGGMIAHMITSVAGSSAYYEGGAVSYSNSVKINTLGVSEADIERYGAVSETVVRQMAEGARKVFNTDCAIATSGIAGPTGGTDDKPVGTTWIAVSTPNGTFSKCCHFGVDRLTNITESAEAAMQFLYEKLI